MIRVNLLAHREERRKGQRRQLGLIAIVFLALGGAVWLAVHGDHRELRLGAERPQRVPEEGERVKLDKQIEEIRKLRDEIKALLARKQIIEALQSDRARAVELLDQLVRQTPDGVYMKTIKQDGVKVNSPATRSRTRGSRLSCATCRARPIVQNHAALAATRRDQGDRGEQAAPVGVQHELPHEAAGRRRGR